MMSARRVCWSCFWLLSIAALVFTAGCGGPKLVSVEGTVTLDGQPVEGASVNFTPANQGEGQMASGTTDASGKFTLSTVGGAGALAGSYKVGVSKVEAGAAQEAEKEAAGAAPAGTTLSGPGGAGPAKSTPPKNLIPVQYVNPEQSGITVEVKAGMAPVAIELKSS